jgi:acetyltransferase-like isoleucine patch superfamily enzyme
MTGFGFIIRLKNVVHNKWQLRRVRNVGKGTNIFGDVNIVYPTKLNIGNNCTINHGAYINALNGVTLGDDVTISARSIIVSTGLDYLSWANGQKKHSAKGEVIIGEHVWIGVAAIILPGVHIQGEYVVIAAGSIVTKNITENRCIYAGCPAKIISKF